MLIDQLTKYLRDTLDVRVTGKSWEDRMALPFFLQDAYVYYHTEIYGLKLLLMVDAGHEELSPATIRKHLEQVRTKWGGEVVYVREQVTSYFRKRLIESGVPFIVPGNQLFLPMLAIDLREYFRQKRKSVHKFSPATQALVLYLIYNNQSSVVEARTTPTEMAKILGYSKMTMSRAFKEVDAALDEVFASKESVNEKKYDLPGRELWDRLKPYWRSPVNRHHYLVKNYFDLGFGLRAGLTAMATYSMLAAPNQEVFAVSQSEWKVLEQRHDIMVLDQPDAHTVGVEVWGYPPNLFAEYGSREAVDPLSLYLSLQDSGDERVELALEELIGWMKW